MVAADIDTFYLNNENYFKSYNFIFVSYFYKMCT